MNVEAEVALAGTYSVSNILDMEDGVDVKSDWDCELPVTFAVINAQGIKWLFPSAALAQGCLQLFAGKHAVILILEWRKPAEDRCNIPEPVA